MKEPVIIFDFDGTLADTFDNFIAIGNALAKEFKFKSVEPHHIETFKDKTIRQAIRDLEVPILQIPKLLIKGKKAQHDHIQNINLVEGMDTVLKRTIGLGEYQHTQKHSGSSQKPTFRKHV